MLTGVPRYCRDAQLCLRGEGLAAFQGHFIEVLWFNRGMHSDFVEAFGCTVLVEGACATGGMLSEFIAAL